MSEAENWSPRDLVEAIRSGDVYGIAEAGMMSYEDADYIADYWQTYEQYHGVDPVGDEDEKYAKLVERASTREFNKAVGSGNISRIAYGVGHQRDGETDIADWKQYEKIKDLFRSEPQYTDYTNNIFQAIIFSNQVPPTGRGKTNTGYTLIDMGQSVNPEMKVWTNSKSDPFEDLPEQWSDIKNTIRNHDGEGLILLDDASVFLQYADQTKGVQMSRELKLLRKNNTHIIIIAHTGMDVPKDIRRQVFMINKLSETEAEFGYGITEMEGQDRLEVSNIQMSIANIPETDINYESEDDQGYEIYFDDDETSENNQSNPTPRSSKIQFPETVNSKTDKIKYLSEVCGMKNKEIADYLEESEQTVSYHLQK
ncbi:hypothetical protein GRX03_01070 [Halovenus sp. WSH3]|uniref:Uncharacterized protein n=1 Tax=Halovenus carboxidivorans TaxID=2692199 RepID=A0A6B0T4I2_9EURY|nr:hypothetical protein [Halovenus carboxidivorans]MXR50202.1 hypothetical protein [Halovenus carboxidivorans]